MKKLTTKIVLILIIAVLSVTLMGCENGGTDGELPKEVNIGYLRVPNDELVAKTM